MSVVDKIIGAVTPIPDEKHRLEGTRKAFDDCKAAAKAAERPAAMQRLAIVLNGHSLAEEVVLYPALAQAGEKAHAGHAYTEQTTARMQMAELETIAPSSQARKDKLQHIEGAVLTPMFEEESGWFPKLKEKGEYQTRLTAPYAEEFDRYTG